MKKLLYISIVVALVGILSPIINTYAQTPSTSTTQGRCSITPIITEAGCKQAGGSWTTPYVLLAPIDIEGGIEEFDPAQEGALGKYLNLMIKIIIGLSSVMAVLMFVIGGIEYMTSELGSSKEAAKSRMTGAVLGLLIALGAYALLNTINPDLLKSDLKIDDVSISVDVPQTAVNGRYSNVRYGSHASGTNWQNVAGAINPLPPGVSLNNGWRECQTVGDTDCSSLRGLDTSLINDLRAQCRSCRLVVTGGTEYWLHSTNTTHHPGSSTVDLRIDDNLNRHIQSGTRDANNPNVYQKDGVRYLWEGDHWHASKQ